METEMQARVEAWRQRFQLNGGEEGGLESALEAAVEIDDPSERIARAREEMRRRVMDDFGGDPALLEAVGRIELTSKEALKVLEEGKRAPEPEEFGSLEAIVAFDGTRPSFLLKEGAIDLESSLSTEQWKERLAPRLADLAGFASCVGRVEEGETAIGTAFLIAPTLAITNRHVAQWIADFDGETIQLHNQVFLDFGREHRGRAKYDRRAVRKILFAGPDRIVDPIDHGKLDLALLEVAPSQLPGELAERKLTLGMDLMAISSGRSLATVGYPGDWRRATPRGLRSEYEEVLAKLLDGDGGSKRFAPGECAGMLAPAAGNRPWTVRHDATTIQGNSGSPLLLLTRSGAMSVVGLHYGGQWRGERTNWAHLLAVCGDARVAPGAHDFRTALGEHGIAV